MRRQSELDRQEFETYKIHLSEIEIEKTTWEKQLKSNLLTFKNSCQQKDEVIAAMDCRLQELSNLVENRTKEILEMRIQMSEMQQNHDTEMRSTQTCLTEYQLKNRSLQAELSERSDRVNKLQESILVETSRQENRVLRLEETLHAAQTEEKIITANLKSKTTELKHLEDLLSETTGDTVGLNCFVFLVTVFQNAVLQVNCSKFL